MSDSVLQIDTSRIVGSESLYDGMGEMGAALQIEAVSPPSPPISAPPPQPPPPIALSHIVNREEHFRLEKSREEENRTWP